MFLKDSRLNLAGPASIVPRFRSSFDTFGCHKPLLPKTTMAPVTQQYLAQDVYIKKPSKLAFGSMLSRRLRDLLPAKDEDASLVPNNLPSREPIDCNATWATEVLCHLQDRLALGAVTEADLSALKNRLMAQPDNLIALDSKKAQEHSENYPELPPLLDRPAIVTPTLEIPKFSEIQSMKVGDEMTFEIPGLDENDPKIVKQPDAKVDFKAPDVIRTPQGSDFLWQFPLGWSEERADRDLLQNPFDGHKQTSEGFKFVIQRKSDGFHVVFHGKSEYKPIYLEYLGLSTKQDDPEAAGFYGEGTKVLPLSLLRDNGLSRLAYSSRNWRVRYFKGRSEGSNDDELMYQLEPVTDAIGQEVDLPGNRIEMVIPDAKRLHRLMDRSLHFFRSRYNKDFVAPDFEGPLGGFKVHLGQAGNIYLNGQRFEYHAQKQDKPKWSESLNGLSLWTRQRIPDVSVGRDRMALRVDDLCTILDAILKTMPTPELLAQLHHLKPLWDMKDPENAHLYKESAPCVILLCRVIEALDARHEKIHFPEDYIVADRYDTPADDVITNTLRNAGFKICYTRLKALGMPTVLQKWSKVSPQKPVEVSPEERLRIHLLRAAVHLFIEEGQLDKDLLCGDDVKKPIYIFDKNNERVQAVTGLYRGTSIGLEKLQLDTASFSENLSTYLHELLHKHGDDESVIFSDKIETMLGRQLDYALRKPHIAQQLKVLQVLWNREKPSIQPFISIGGDSYRSKDLELDALQPLPPSDAPENLEALERMMWEIEPEMQEALRKRREGEHQPTGTITEIFNRQSKLVHQSRSADHHVPQDKGIEVALNAILEDTDPVAQTTALLDCVIGSVVPEREILGTWHEILQQMRETSDSAMAEKTVEITPKRSRSIPRVALEDFYHGGYSLPCDFINFPGFDTREHLATQTLPPLPSLDTPFHMVVPGYLQHHRIVKEPSAEIDFANMPNAGQWVKTRLTRNYPIHWSMMKCFRDVLQNVNDAQGYTLAGATLTIEQTEPSTYEVTVETPSEYHPSYLEKMGKTSKLGNDKAAGKFGEATKILPLLLKRDFNIDYVNESRNWRMSHDFFPLNSVKTDVLHRRLEKVPDRPGSRVKLTMHDPQQVLAFYNCFNFFRHAANPDFAQATFSNDTGGFSFKGVGKKGSLYYSGQRFEYNHPSRHECTWSDGLENLSFWLNAHIPNVPVDRDRTALDYSQLNMMMRHLVDSMKPREILRAMTALEPLWDRGKLEALEKGDVETSAGFLFLYILLRAARKQNITTEFPPQYVAEEHGSEKQTTSLERKALHDQGIVICDKDFARLGMQTISQFREERWRHLQIAPSMDEKLKLSLLQRAAKLLVAGGYAQNQAAVRFDEQLLEKPLVVYDSSQEVRHNPRDLPIQYSQDCLWVDRYFLHTDRPFADVLMTYLNTALQKRGTREDADYSYALTHWMRNINDISCDSKLVAQLRVFDSMWRMLDPAHPLMPKESPFVKAAVDPGNVSEAQWQEEEQEALRHRFREMGIEDSRDKAILLSELSEARSVLGDAYRKGWSETARLLNVASQQLAKTDRMAMPASQERIWAVKAKIAETIAKEDPNFNSLFPDEATCTLQGQVLSLLNFLNTPGRTRNDLELVNTFIAHFIRKTAKDGFEHRDDVETLVKNIQNHHYEGINKEVDPHLLTVRALALAKRLDLLRKYPISSVMAQELAFVRSILARGEQLKKHCHPLLQVLAEPYFERLSRLYGAYASVRPGLFVKPTQNFDEYKSVLLSSQVLEGADERLKTVSEAEAMYQQQKTVENIETLKKAHHQVLQYLITHGLDISERVFTHPVYLNRVAYEELFSSVKLDF